MKKSKKRLILHYFSESTTDVQGRSQTLYTTLCNGLVSHWAQIGGIADHTHTHKNKCKQMRPRSSCTAVRHFTHVYHHAQTAVDAGDICTWWTTVIFITGKTWIPPLWAPCRDKNGAGSGISLFLPCIFVGSTWFERSSLHILIPCLKFMEVGPFVWMYGLCVFFFFFVSQYLSH